MVLSSFVSSRSFKYTQSPNPNWSYGQEVASTDLGKEWIVAGETDGWEVVDAATEDPARMYKLLTSGIVPRPIAFVSTTSELGIDNLAPFRQVIGFQSLSFAWIYLPHSNSIQSWFNTVSHDPPVISISCTNVPRHGKDTTRNIKATKGFTVSIISEPWVEQANACSINAPEGISEWPLSGLTKERSIHVGAPRVKESAFSMECELFQAIDIVHPQSGEATTTLILGLVKYVHVRNGLLTDKGTIDPALLKPLGRLGDSIYSPVVAGFRLGRPTYALAEKQVADASKSANL